MRSPTLVPLLVLCVATLVACAPSTSGGGGDEDTNVCGSVGGVADTCSLSWGLCDDEKAYTIECPSAVNGDPPTMTCICRVDDVDESTFTTGTEECPFSDDNAEITAYANEHCGWDIGLL